MATRIKRLQSTFLVNEAGSAFTITEQPSTTGDIVTRVLISRIIVNGTVDNNMQYTLRLNCGTVNVVSATFAGFNAPLVLSGSDAVSYTTPVSVGGGRLTGLQGSGYIYNSVSSATYSIPSSFYSVPGESLVISVVQGTSTTMAYCTGSITLVCIGEY